MLEDGFGNGFPNSVRRAISGCFRCGEEAHRGAGEAGMCSVREAGAWESPSAVVNNGFVEEDDAVNVLSPAPGGNIPMLLQPGSVSGDRTTVLADVEVSLFCESLVLARSRPYSILLNDFRKVNGEPAARRLPFTLLLPVKQPEPTLRKSKSMSRTPLLLPVVFPTSSAFTVSSNVRRSLGTLFPSPPPSFPLELLDDAPPPAFLAANNNCSGESFAPDAKLGKRTDGSPIKNAFLADEQSVRQLGAPLDVALCPGISRLGRFSIA